MGGGGEDKNFGTTIEIIIIIQKKTRSRDYHRVIVNEYYTVGWNSR